MGKDKDRKQKIYESVMEVMTSWGEDWASAVLQYPVLRNVPTHRRSIIEQKVLPFYRLPICSLYSSNFIFTSSLF